MSDKIKRTRKSIPNPFKVKRDMAKKIGKGPGSFIKKLEAHKAKERSFDDGTWKPKRKGQSFIEALEEHKRDSEFFG